MSKPSNNQAPTNKKIAKAAKAGGSRARSRVNVSWSYWGSVVGICVLGIALVVGSIIGKSIAEAAPFAASTSSKVAKANKEVQKLLDQKKPDAKKLAAATKKRDDLIADTHWHSAYGVYKCDSYLGKLVGDKYVAEIDGTALPDPAGIHAHDDGLIHIHPFIKRASGKKAQLSWFLESVDAKITSSKISYPALTGKTETFDVNKLTCGKDKKKPVVSVYLWRDIKKPGRVERYTGDFGKIPLVKNGAYAFAITAPGSKTPGIPPSEKALEAPSDLPQAVPTTVPAGGAPTTTAVAGSTQSTVAPASTKAPAAGAATTTVASIAPASSAPTSTSPATTAAPTTTQG